MPPLKAVASRRQTGSVESRVYLQYQIGVSAKKNVVLYNPHEQTGRGNHLVDVSTSLASYRMKRHVRQVFQGGVRDVQSRHDVTTLQHVCFHCPAYCLLPPQYSAKLLFGGAGWVEMKARRFG